MKVVAERAKIGLLHLSFMYSVGGHVILFFFFFFINVILQSRVETPKKEVVFYMQYSVFVNVKHMVCKITDDAQMFLSLYDAKDEHFIRYKLQCSVK